MENKEKELLEQLRQGTENTKVPDKLSPQNIEEQLKQTQNKKKKPKYYIWGSAVAACFLLIGVISVVRTSFRGTESHRQQPQPSTIATMLSTEMQVARDYAQVYEYLENARQEYGTESKGLLFSTRSEIERGETTMVDEAVSMDTASVEFSDTNIREEGVGESDYVKTDGRYIYLRKDDQQTVEIVDTKDKQMISIGSIEVEEHITIVEFYLHEDRLIMLCNEAERKSDTDIVDPGFAGPNFGGWYGSGNTLVRTYDISKPENPKKIGDVTQSGNFFTSRIADGYIYTFSQYYATSGVAREDVGAYIPKVNGVQIEEQRIVMPFIPMGEKYIVITSVEIANPTEIVDSKAVFSQGGQCYVSTESIYIYQYQYRSALGDEFDSNVDGVTNIQKIEYKDGRLHAKAQNTIYGYLESSFSIDEYDNYLRTVTTVQSGDKQSNAVYVLDANMEIVGQIEDLAKDERVYSARLMGEIGYFVTFRETDPLFSVDFSDPRNPEIIGELKIPGFSEYLHPYNEHLLFGIGMEVDEKTLTTSGVKISMFDISDPTQVEEIDKYVLEGVYSSDAFYDYKAVLVAESKDIVGFSADSSRGEKYYIFDYEEGVGFDMKFDKQVNGTSYVVTRGFYIDDVLYIVKGNLVESYSLVNYQKIDDIIL